MASSLNEFHIFEKFTVNQKIRRQIKTTYVFCDTLPLTHERLNVFIITEHDTVHGFGSNSKGCLGFGHQNCVAKLTIVKGLSNKGIIDFSYNFNFMIARSKSGEIYIWGLKNDNSIQSTNASAKLEMFTKPYRLNLNNIKDVCSGNNFSLLSNRKEVFILDGFHSSQSSNCNFKPSFGIKKIFDAKRENIIQIASGADYSIFLTENGDVYTWENKESSKSFIEIFFEIFRLIGDESYKNEPKHLEIKKNDSLYEKFVKIACGKKISLLLTIDGYIYTYGRNQFGQLEIINPKKQLNPYKKNKFVKFIDVIANFCNDILIALSNEGVYYVWGEYGKNNMEKTKFESPFSIFAKYYQFTHKTMYVIIDNKQFDSGSLQNGKYKREFNEFFVIGTGSSGIVYKSQWTYDYKNYAIKKVPIFKEYSKELIDDLNIMSKLKCDYVVHCLTFWIEDNSTNVSALRESGDIINLSYRHPVFDVRRSTLIYIQFELCPGTLKDFIERISDDEHPFPYTSWPCIKYYITCELLKELLECVDYLHKQTPPIIHRDLKPTNILITYGNKGRLIKLSDFGSVAIHEFEEQSHTQGIGTLKYMAPEIMMSRNYDTKADIYSLGVIMHDLFDLNNESIIRIPKEYKNKLENLQLISDKSVSYPDKNSRPYCSDILRACDTWALKLNDLSKSVEIEKFADAFHFYNNKDFITLMINEKFEILDNYKSENFKKERFSQKPNTSASINEIKAEGRLLKSVEFGKSLQKHPELLYPNNSEQYGHENSTIFSKDFKRGKYYKEFKEINVIYSGTYSIVCKSKCIQNSQIYAVKKVVFNSNSQYIVKMIDVCEKIRKLNTTFVVEYKSFWIENNYIKDRERYNNIDGNSEISLSHCVFDPYNDLLLHIQMEFCSKNLREVIKQVNKELTQSLAKDFTILRYYIASEILIEILQCVNYLHKQNPPIIHRDLKPTNILIKKCEKGRFIKLSDFDLLTFHKSDETSHTQASGTIKYMAPEVMKTRKYNTKADIYSLGIIISELFDFDSHSQIDMDNELSISHAIKLQYIRIVNESEKMILFNPELRPDCGMLLSKRKFWALSLSDLKNEINLDEIMENKNNDLTEEEELFHHEFLRAKMKLDS